MRTRISLAEVMTVILLSAIDVRAIRSIIYHEGGPTDALLSTAGTLVFTILGAGLLALRRRRRRGVSAPFLMGFEIVGGSCLLIYSLAAVLLPELLLDHFKGFWSPCILYIASTTIGRSKYFILTVEMAMMVHFSAILLIPAMITGLLGRYLKRVPSGGEVRGRRLSTFGPDDSAPPEPSLQHAYPIACLLAV